MILFKFLLFYAALVVLFTLFLWVSPVIQFVINMALGFIFRIGGDNA